MVAEEEVEEAEVKEEEEEMVVVLVVEEAASPEILQEADPTLKVDGQESNAIQINLHLPVVKNTSDSEKVLTGVKNQEPARGKTTGHRKIIENLTSLILID